MAGFSEAGTVNLRRRFDSYSIAVIGASAMEGTLGYEAMRNVADVEGPLDPINPDGEAE